jgi:sugar phosphate permease
MKLPKCLTFLKQAPSIKRITDKEELKKSFRHWRIQAFYSVSIGYAMFYFCRKNISTALPAIKDTLGYTKTDLGIVLSLFTITYAFAKLINGVLCDRANPRYFMAVGLALGAIFNIFFGLSSSIFFFAIFWMLNGFVQTMGSPIIPKTMANWFSIRERGTIFSFANTSLPLGAALILFSGGYVVQYGGWRAGFIIPGIFCIFGAIFIAWKMVDRPESVGLPPIMEYHGEEKAGTEDSDVVQHESMWHVLWHNVLTDYRIWVISISCIFLYIVRYGIVDWGTTYLSEVKGDSYGIAGLKVGFLELCGIPGAIFAGIVSDRVFKGRRIPISIICMVGVAFSLWLLYITPKGHPVIDTIALGMSGFFIYGPQTLVSQVAPTDIASRKAAGAAVGLTGFMSYIGAALAGWLIGYLADTAGWKGAFTFLIGSALACAAILLIVINARASHLKNDSKTT